MSNFAPISNLAQIADDHSDNECSKGSDGSSPINVEDDVAVASKPADNDTNVVESGHHVEPKEEPIDNDKLVIDTNEQPQQQQQQDQPTTIMTSTMMSSTSDTVSTSEADMKPEMQPVNCVMPQRSAAESVITSTTEQQPQG